MPDEPVVFPRKKVATKVKHWILERCLTAWGGIIVNSNSGEVRFSFVDTCCGSGLYESSDDDTEPADGKYEAGSALIGPQELAFGANAAYWGAHGEVVYQAGSYTVYRAR